MRYRMIILTTIGVLLLGSSSVSCASASPAFGTTYYIDTNHPQAEDSSNHGSLGEPWKTIEYALQQLQPGDTVIVRGGIYDESRIVPTRHGGTEQAPITVKAYPGEEVVWRGGQQGYLWHFIGGQHWIIEGIIFENGFILGESPDEVAEHLTVRHCQFRDSNTGGIFIKYARHIVIDDCSFVNIRSNRPGADTNAIALSRVVDDLTIRNSRFEDIGSDGVHLGGREDAQIGTVVIENNEFLVSGQRSPVGENGIDIKNVQGPIVVRGNSFHGFRQTVAGQDASGGLGEALNLISVYPNGGPAAKNVTIERNLFYDNRIHLWISRGSDNVLVINNVFRDAYGDPALGIFVLNATNVRILHNTFFNNARNIWSDDLAPTTVILKDNVFSGGDFSMPPPDQSGLAVFKCDYNAYSGIVGGVPSILTSDHDVWVDDPGLDVDLRPLLGSPLIDAGRNVGVSDDFDGKLRFDGLPDLGAFEREQDGTLRITLPFLPFQAILPSVRR